MTVISTLYKRFVMLSQAIENNRLPQYRNRADIKYVSEPLMHVYDLPDIHALMDSQNRYTGSIALRRATAAYIYKKSKNEFRRKYSDVDLRQRLDSGIHTLYFLERAVGLRPRVVLIPPDEVTQYTYSKPLLPEYILTDDLSSLNQLPDEVKNAILTMANNPYISRNDFPDHVRPWLRKEALVVDVGFTPERTLLQNLVNVSNSAHTVLAQGKNVTPALMHARVILDGNIQSSLRDIAKEAKLIVP